MTRFSAGQLWRTKTSIYTEQKRLTEGHTTVFQAEDAFEKEHRRIAMWTIFIVWKIFKNL
jgi:hypothetical protein